jgi:hypothetical protein
MSLYNKVANTNTTNIVPVQGTFDQNGTNINLIGGKLQVTMAQHNLRRI